MQIYVFHWSYHKERRYKKNAQWAVGIREHRTTNDHIYYNSVHFPESVSHALLYYALHLYMC